jgi:hypothetical protein
MYIQNFTYISLNCTGSSAGAKKERVGSENYFVSTLRKNSLESSHKGREATCFLQIQEKKLHYPENSMFHVNVHIHLSNQTASFLN